jgi:hypothetical protein
MTVTWKQWTGGRIHRSREFKTTRGAEAFATRLRERLDVSDIHINP